MSPPRMFTDAQIIHARQLYAGEARPTSKEIAAMADTVPRAMALVDGGRPQQHELALLLKTSKSGMLRILSGERYCEIPRVGPRRMRPPRMFTDTQIIRARQLYAGEARPTSKEIAAMADTVPRAMALVDGGRPQQHELALLLKTSKSGMLRILSGERYRDLPGMVSTKPYVPGGKALRGRKDGIVAKWEPAVPRPLAEPPASCWFDTDPRAVADHGTPRAWQGLPMTDIGKSMTSLGAIASNGDA